MRRTGSISNSRSGPYRPARIALLLLVAASACHAGEAPAPSPASSAATEIEAALTRSAEAWNRGDLDGYLAPYAPDATFVGSTGLVRGRDDIRRRYVEGYWGSGAPRDALRFSFLDLRMLDRNAAVLVGRYFLYDRESGETTSEGNFSLTLERQGGAWTIVHDHSSAAEQ